MGAEKMDNIFYRLDFIPTCIYCYSYDITLCQGRPGPVPGDTPAPGHVAGGRPQQTGEKREHGKPQYLIFDLQCSVIFIQKDVCFVLNCLMSRLCFKWFTVSAQKASRCFYEEAIIH